MIGLTYIRSSFNKSMQNVADRLGISKQTVSKWENGQRPIPEKRLNELADLFNLPLKYFDKELSDIEKYEIECIKLKKKLGYYEDNEGNKIININSNEDMKMSMQLELIEEKIDSLKVIDKITRIMTFEDLDKNISSTEQVSNIINSYELLSDIILSKKANLNVISNLVYSMALYYGAAENDEEQIEKEWGKYPLWMNDLYCTNEGFINKVFDLLKEEEERLKKAYEEKEKFYNEE